MNSRCFAVAALGLLAASAAWAADPPATKKDTALGPVLTDPRGMTLYTFDKDEKGKSACTGDCAQLWPPFTAASNAKAEGDFTMIDRGDGTKQWAHRGKPLYLWSKDTKPGETGGDGFKGVWHAAKP